MRFDLSAQLYDDDPWGRALGEVFARPEPEVEPADQGPVMSLKEFASRVHKRYIWHRHSELLCAALQRVSDGQLKRLMVFMPPREGKSELVSRIFPAYQLYRRPDEWVAVTSYAAELAYTLSRAARDNFIATGGSMRGDASAVKHWETTSGGGLWASGVGGPATGKGFSTGVIDDPLKDAEEALSELIRKTRKEWYQSTFYTRRAPGASIVIAQTRWHSDDLSGWLLTEEEFAPEGWHILNFPAIAEEHPQVFPVTCTVEPDWREPGEALTPSRFPIEELEKTKAVVGQYFWNAQYQQRPIAAGGTVFKEDWWKYYDELPPVWSRLVISVDCSFKDEDDHDYVVMQAWGQTRADVYLLDQVRARLDFPNTCTGLTTFSAKWPKAGAKYVEDKANGTAVIQTLRRKIPGIIPVEPEGGKLARAHATSPYVESGNVYLPGKLFAARRAEEWRQVARAPRSWLPTEAVRGDWVASFVAEHSAFPRGAYDDQVDAETQALNKMLGQLSSGERRPSQPRRITSAAGLAIASLD
jgi:predicted phage terminase large subunit-like protein